MAWRRCSARNTAAEIPPRSVPIRTRCTPTAPSAVSMRWIMLAFSAVGNTDACVTNRRMSRPDSGLATIPTIASPTAAHLLGSTVREDRESGIAAARSVWAGYLADASWRPHRSGGG